MRYEVGVHHALNRLAVVVLAILGPLCGQDLQPLERQALAHAAAGQPVAAAAALLDGAVAASAEPVADAAVAARVEAWATAAAHYATGVADAALLARFDALQRTPLAQRDRLLADRIAVAALTAAGPLLPADGERLRRLGVLREFWLIGPFANERGAGYRTALAPEQGLDLAAELPGKRRPVRWRQLPPLGPRAALPLQRLLHPHEQSLAYAAVAVHSDRAQHVVLELGSTGSVRVFCNGVEVFAREVERAFAFDQDAVALPLAAGPNLLLLKLCHQEGDEFTFAARLRGLDGAAAAVRASVARDDMLAAGKAVPAALAEPPPVALGGRSTWQIDAAQQADALRLAWLWRARKADGDRERRDAAAALAATAQLPDVADSWLTLATARRRHGRSAADRDENDRRRALEQALRCDPAHVEALVELGDLLRGASKLWRQAQDLADRALKVQPAHAGAVLLRCACLRDAKMDVRANNELLLAAANTTTGPALLAAAADALAREPARALPLWQRLHADHGGEGNATAAAHALARTGNVAAATELLRAVVAADAFARNARWQLTELELAAGRPRAALELLEAWLQIAPDDATFLAQAARCWHLLRSDDPAAANRQLELLREALAVEPTRRDDERYADYLASEASSGPADANAFYAPHRVDAAALLAADPGPLADSAANNDALHWLLRQTVVQANGNGTTSAYTHLIARVLSNDGARSLQTYQLPFYAGEQRGRLLACTVFRQDGTVQRPTLQGARVRLPDLRPGDTVAIEGRVDDLAPSFFGDYFGLVHVFAAPDGSPVRAEELIVLAEPGRDYRVQAGNGAPAAAPTTLADGTLQYRWRMQDLPRDVPELRRPARREHEPIVRMTTYRDWDQFAGWWWNLIKPQLEVTPAMRATVAKLCEGRATTEAKIAAIYHFVTTDVRYEAWEFGVHGYKPYSTAVIHDRRHGDCKDKALLLSALLGEIGVPCHPVLIFADPLRTADDLTLAMVQQFNHCIAWLPPHDGRPGRFLDGTAVWHPTDTLPEMDQGAAVLVVDRGRAELRTVPTTTPAANRSQVDYVVELAPAGTAQLRLDERPLGNAAVGLREMLATEPARRREVIERRLVRSFGKAEVQRAEDDAATDPEAPPTLRVEATLAEIGQRNGATWQLPSCPESGDLMALAADTERHRPLLLGPPRGDVRTLRYRLPAGWRPAELPPPVQQETAFGAFSMRWQRDGDSVLVVRELQLLTPRIAVADHAAFRDFATAVRAADAQLVLLQQEGGR